MPTVYLKWPSEPSTSSHQTAPYFPLFHDSHVSDKHFHLNRKSYFEKSNASLHFTKNRLTIQGATWSCKNSDQSCWSHHSLTFRICLEVNLAHALTSLSQDCQSWREARHLLTRSFRSQRTRKHRGGWEEEAVFPPCLMNSWVPASPGVVPMSGC